MPFLLIFCLQYNYYAFFSQPAELVWFSIRNNRKYFWSELKKDSFTNAAPLIAQSDLWVFKLLFFLDFSKIFYFRYLMTYHAHYLSVYKIDYNKYSSNIFASCSGDWRVKIWEDMRRLLNSISNIFLRKFSLIMTCGIYNVTANRCSFLILMPAWAMSNGLRTRALFWRRSQPKARCSFSTSMWINTMQFVFNKLWPEKPLK